MFETQIAPSIRLLGVFKRNFAYRLIRLSLSLDVSLGSKPSSLRLREALELSLGLA
jgi:hypothetical protein